MRKITVSEFVTLNDVMEGPGGERDFKYAGWTMPYVSSGFMQFKHAELFAADALLLGRITYEGFAAAWPKMTETGEFGERINSMPKYVASRTLKKLEWNNSHLLEEDVMENIRKLKEQEGKTILVFGSGTLVQDLIQENLVDEFNLLVYPVVLPTGKKLFREGTSAALRWLESKEVGNGVVLMRYACVKD